jgi:uncharacterized integral membrane protein
MLDPFLELSVINGLLTMVLGTVVPGIVFIFFVRKMVIPGLRKQHERVGRLLFRVSASLLALLISLSYANEKVNYDKVVNSLEEEAAVITTVMLKLKIHRTQLAEEIREGLMEYVQFTIDDRFERAVDNPYYSKMWATMIRLNIFARELESNTEKQKMLKESIIVDINQITSTLQVRFYSTKFKLPYLTYILGFGLVVVWSFFSVYRFDTISVVFISLYNTFIAVLMYFVIMLGNPMTGPLKIAPESFNILLKMGIDKLPF